MVWDNDNLINVLKSSGVVVIPTDTLYGILGSALDENVVEKIYEIRKRRPDKPCIILIGDINDISKFSIDLTEKQKQELQKNWPGPVSVVLDCVDEKFGYLHRGTNTLAFRLPANGALKDLLLKTGPLIAPSANTEGNTPARNIQEAKKYFGDKVDLYVDGGEIEGKASKVIKLNTDGTVVVLRE